MWHLPGHWTWPWHVALASDRSWACVDGLEPGYRYASWSNVGPRLVGLPLGVRMGLPFVVSPRRHDCSWVTAKKYWNQVTGLLYYPQMDQSWQACVQGTDIHISAWYLFKRTASGLQLSLSGAKLWSYCKIYGQSKIGGPSSGSMAGHASCQTLRWAGLLDCSWEGREQSYSTTSRSALGPESTGLPPGACTSVPAGKSLGRGEHSQTRAKKD